VDELLSGQLPGSHLKESNNSDISKLNALFVN